VRWGGKISIFSLYDFIFFKKIGSPILSKFPAPTPQNTIYIPYTLNHKNNHAHKCMILYNCVLLGAGVGAGVGFASCPNNISRPKIHWWFWVDTATFFGQKINFAIFCGIIFILKFIKKEINYQYFAPLCLPKNYII